MRFPGDFRWWCYVPGGASGAEAARALAAFGLDAETQSGKVPAPAVIIPAKELHAFLENHQANPHGWLGMHPLTHEGVAGVVVRAFVRAAVKCAVVELDGPGAPAHPMTMIAPEGFFELFIPGKKVFRYQLRYEVSWGDIHQVHNAYSFLPSLSEQDLYLFNEGNEHRIYEKLGAHQRLMGEVPGVAFAVWAPTASRVSLVGNFNTGIRAIIRCGRWGRPACGSCSCPAWARVSSTSLRSGTARDKCG
jgi:hypothetical protein